MTIDGIDHLVLTVADIDITCAFYSEVLGMRIITFGADRKALAFGTQKINLHRYQHEYEPRASRPTPGSADLCLVTFTEMNEVLAHLAARNVAIIEGPVRRTGARGPLLSVYIRDPDLNLIEIANRLEE